jgi:hypothetical protein
VEAPESWGTFSISAVTRKGLLQLLEGLYRQTREEVKRSGDEEEEEEWWVPE